MAEQPAHKRKRERSPSYPGISLETAIGRAEALLGVEGRNAVPVDVVLKDWGYNPGSGMGLVTLAALKKFGLLVDEGAGRSRQARLSELGLRIVLDVPESPDRLEAIREAALKPAIHTELWRHYNGSLPSDEAIKVRLRRDLGFTDRAVGEFIPQFRKTVAFAKLDASVSLPLSEDEHVMPAAPSTSAVGERQGSARQRTVQVPLLNGEWAFVQADFPLTENAWQQFLRVLEVMKPGLVAVDPYLGHDSDPAIFEGRSEGED